MIVFAVSFVILLNLFMLILTFVFAILLFYLSELYDEMRFALLMFVYSVRRGCTPYLSSIIPVYHITCSCEWKTKWLFNFNFNIKYCTAAILAVLLALQVVGGGFDHNKSVCLGFLSCDIYIRMVFDSFIVVV
jgi:hypothetical protein